MKAWLLGAFALALALASSASHATTANQAVIGYETTSGCPSLTLTPCFVPYGSTVPTTGGGGGGTIAGGWLTAVVGTPLAVTNASTPGTVTGSSSITEVMLTNVGTTNAAYCGVGATATTGYQQIAPNGGWFVFQIASGSNAIACITSSSTTAVNVQTGSGLATGTGGGGGSSGGGGLSVTDEAAFTAGTSPFTPVGGQYKTSQTPLTSGQSGMLALDANRNVQVNCVTGCSGGTADANLTTTGSITTANVFGTGLSNVGNGVLTGTATAGSQITSTGQAGWNTIYVECSGLGTANNSWFEFDKTGGGGGANQWKRMAAFTGPNFSGAFNVAGATGFGIVADQFGSASPNCQLRASVNLATLDASSGPFVGTLNASLAMNSITTTQAIAAVPGLSIAVTGWSEVTSGAATVNGQWQLVSGTGTNCGTGTANVRTAKNFSTGNGIGMAGSVGQQFTLPPGTALCVSDLVGSTAPIDLDFTYGYE